MGDPYTVNDREFESVLRLPAPKRYEHFVKRVSDTEAVVLLAEDDRPIVLSDEHGASPSQLPVWTHPRYAEAYRDAFGGAAWDEIDLAQFLDELLPGLDEDGIDVAVMPLPSGTAVVVPAARLRDDLLAYHDEWYGGWPKYSSGI